jgi:prevent-host-death family protein
MTIHVNVAKAKATLSELMARAEAGEEVVLTRNGKPAIVFTPVKAAPKAGPRVPGAWAKYGAFDPNLFIGPDPETDAAMAEHRIFPDDV